ncbi:MAG: hypothetical protein QGG74_00985 [Phycisphaerales bacterium]|jgi:hypothetical protein|nr:hypothetical protein [Phycisphaerales bacterium]
MRSPRQLGTIVLVTIVTILIWLLAAAKTRETETIAGRLDFTVASDSSGERYDVSPSPIPMTITIEGPALAVRDTRDLLNSSPLHIPLPAQHGRQEIANLAKMIQGVEAIRDLGVSILSVDPARVTIDVTEFVTRTAVVRADIQAASTVQDVSVTPKDVQVTVPRSVARQLPDPLIVEAVVDPRDITRLEPGVLHTVDGTLRLPGSALRSGPITIEPASSRVSFQLLARQRRATVPRVRIQIISSPQDFGTYQVTLGEPLLSDVDIEASPEDIADVEAGAAQIIAMVHLTTNDKERAVETKAVSFFAIVRPDGTATPVLGSLKDNPHPEIALSITRVQ